MFDGSDWYYRSCLDGQRSTPELSAWCHDFGTTEDLGGLEDLTGFCVVSDTPMGRVTLDFEDTYGKLLRVTLRDENGSDILRVTAQMLQRSLYFFGRQAHIEDDGIFTRDYYV